ncbi:phospholipase D family protein [Salinibacter ruber]|jgi:hypothetical protein|uniref:Phospholipase D-like domain-containing protein n=1 Tax=Salinibacter ruber TaxID=146919 RepID=A0AAW5PDM5_9BACT|nr:phospholipase D family protein [Salinibacter ruber]MCS4159420.1 hypothetical protein [Salinibacter ruber]MCS4223684.1 hypothetical protein [Salinibacter ruber]
MFVRVVTWWKTREIAAGVSDLEVWRVLQERGNSTLELLPSLHAKCYQFDEICLSGSANLTGAAIGWSESSNLEFLTRFPAERAFGFEDELVDCQVVSEDTHQRYRRKVQKYGDTESGEALVTETDPVVVEEVTHAREDQTQTGAESETTWWIPELKEPNQLYQVYVGDSGNVPPEA